MRSCWETPWIWPYFHVFWCSLLSWTSPDPQTDVLNMRFSLSLCAACIFLLRFTGKCGERSTPTAILHNGQSARECDVGVGADSSAPHMKATLKRFGKNLGGVRQHLISHHEGRFKSVGNLVLSPEKPDTLSRSRLWSCTSAQCTSITHGDGWFLHWSGNIRQHKGTPVCFQARQLDVIRPVAKVK